MKADKILLGCLAGVVLGLAAICLLILGIFAAALANTDNETADIIKSVEIPIVETEYIGEFETTAYCKCSECCGIWTDSPTKSGTTPKQGRTIAVDPNVIPLGTEVVIDGNTYIAEDTGSAIVGNRIDIYFNEHADALKYGRQMKEVYGGLKND